MVKDFSSFPNRRTIPFAPKPMSDTLLLLKNDRWKRVRSIVSPSFSGMVPLINTASDALMNNLNVHAESGEAFDIHRCLGCFTMDVIASVAFATQVDSQNKPDDPFVHHAKMFFSLSFLRPIILFFSQSLLLLVFEKFMRRDFLQLILDARTSDEMVSLEHFDTANHADELDHRNQRTQASASDQDSGHPHPQESPVRRPQKKKMTEDEVVGQAFVFLLAGYETSSNTLAFTCYLLALHPECQRRVQEEVDDFFTRHVSSAGIGSAPHDPSED
uniref:Thromboxane-A synthase n=1 Tax=Stegastes partitus TaxID=144197 RepID=A0A3B5AZ78_9TELE